MDGWRDDGEKAGVRRQGPLQRTSPAGALLRTCMTMDQISPEKPVDELYVTVELPCILEYEVRRT